MGKKNQKKLVELMGDSQGVEFKRYVLNSAVTMRTVPESKYISRFYLDLSGKNVLGSDLETINVHFIPDEDPLAPPYYAGSYVICEQHLSSLPAFMEMIKSGIDGEASTLYGFYSPKPDWVQFMLVSGDLSQKEILSMVKQEEEDVGVQDGVVFPD